MQPRRLHHVVFKNYNMDKTLFNNKYIFAALLISIFAAGIFLRVGFLNAKYLSGTDEGYYLKYSVYMATEHNASLKTLARSYIENESWHVFPSPLRAGYIMMSSLWMKALGLFNFKALALLSSLFSILSLFLVFIFTKELFGKRIAFFSLILFASSPLSLALARRALQDSAVYFFIIMSVYLFYKARFYTGLIFKALFAASFFAALMIKESAVLLTAFFLIVLLWDIYARRHKARNCLSLVLAIAVALAAAFFVYLNIAGGFANFIKMAKIIIISPLNNFYAVRYQSGPFFRYMLDFFLISPYTLISAVAFLALYFSNAIERTAQATYLVIFFLSLYMTFSLFSKNMRYVVALDVPIRIFTAMFIANLFRNFKKKELFFSSLTIIMIALSDIYIFNRQFLVQGTYDPVTASLLWGWGVTN